ncbi:fused signal recognition particle receptor [Candidatus Kinetoplastibacterium desouzaii TCC079E]|uniref:Fused signal recognition particle receptor n=1 Tax=Candidatus Kinetoplastidibacterium desouzai TCC079E TaxID=1208919 RepID=M1LM79_9PROT|nr:signal recognition particle-docking protein FtsY [Candidatus Kinetoplastibacterium desouzaii]AGF46827.1 fused signal recognition particle receptor [Candidatus Kinetoplastibacterium desouzaii TCC079E]
MINFFKHRINNIKNTECNEDNTLKTNDKILEEDNISSIKEIDKSSSLFKSLKKSFSYTSDSLNRLFKRSKIDDSMFEELENILIMADVGFDVSVKLLSLLRDKVKKDKITNPSDLKKELRIILTDHLRSLEGNFVINCKPTIILVVGVNGVGKTTSIGKLASYFKLNGSKVLLIAADTFRAAAIEQLTKWGNINDIMVFSKDVKDPSSVVFEGVNFGKSKGFDVIIVDTAGRLPSNDNLMNELVKIKRVISKINDSDDQETILIVDGNLGQNTINQISSFDNALKLSGLFITKMDGTAKGGVLAAIASNKNRNIPVYWVGIGEKKDDILPFVAKNFAEAMLDG